MNLQQRGSATGSLQRCGGWPAYVTPVLPLDATWPSSAPASPARSSLSPAPPGRSVVLLERGRHPRFAIGESSTPLANLLLEELADRYDLPRLRAAVEVGHLAADAIPRSACGLKRGFTFFVTVRTSRLPKTRSTRASCSWRPARTTRSRTRTGTGRTFDQFLVAGGRRRRARVPRGDTASMARVTTARRRALGAPARAVPSRSRPRLRHRRERAAGLPAPRSRTAGDAPLRWLPADAGALHATSTGVDAWDDVVAAGRDAALSASTTRRSTTSSTAAGSGCCGSTTGSPARARR